MEKRGDLNLFFSRVGPIPLKIRKKVEDQSLIRKRRTRIERNAKHRRAH